VTWRRYEALYARARAAEAAGAASGRPTSVRDALMGFFLSLKGESVLASINSFEQMRRTAAEAGGGSAASGADAAGGGVDVGSHDGALSGALNALMRLNIFEAVLSNLSFAKWPGAPCAAPTHRRLGRMSPLRPLSHACDG
jgi:hypothetical protein